MSKRFQGSFEALVRQGKTYGNHERFRPLGGAGRPLWEFKEHDHRIYCERVEFQNGSVRVVLLSGWVKDKAGKAAEEKNEITVAQNLLTERTKEGARK